MDHRPSVEADAALRALLDEAGENDAILITRDGQPVAELRRLPPQGPVGEGPASAGDVAWLRHRRVTPLTPDFDSVALIRQMRDKD